MKTKFIVFFLLFSKLLLAQSENDKIVYLDSLWKETTKEKQVYYRIIKDYYSEKTEYRFETYYKSGKIEIEGNSEIKDYFLRIGLIKEYYENGSLKSESNYEKGRQKGKQTLWYDNGVKKMESEFVLKEGELIPELKINQFWSKENKQEVIDGNGYMNDIYENGSSKGNLINGWKNGIWEGEDKTNKFSYTENYENGKLINGKSIDSQNVEHTYTTVMLQPRPKKGLEHFYKYIGKKFKIPRNLENLSGKIVLTFVIDKEGNATDVTVVKSLEEDLDNQAIKLIENYPDWSSGELRGIKVKVLYSIPIKVVAAE
ncbi:energy transducer TonB [Flavobacterium sp. N1994]|uniref:energy transducer TonB n=1 Tax=Flavobacterium sp. N1994 TaxID=2986827 RepID=UPI00222170EA|nr:energy transducer TonB [Flavobacterium sp. N1994]